MHILIRSCLKEEAVSVTEIKHAGEGLGHTFPNTLVGPELRVIDRQDRTNVFKFKFVEGFGTVQKWYKLFMHMRSVHSVTEEDLNLGNKTR